MAVRLLTRKEVAARLSEFSCEFLEDVENPSDPYYAYAYWKAGFGFNFTLPLVGPDKLCPEPDVYEVLTELSKLRAQMAANSNGKPAKPKGR